MQPMKIIDPSIQDLEGWPEWAHYVGAKIGPADGTPMVPVQVLGLVRLKGGSVVCKIRIEADTGVEIAWIYKEHTSNWGWLQVPRLTIISQDD